MYELNRFVNFGNWVSFILMVFLAYVVISFGYSTIIRIKEINFYKTADRLVKA
ncbi:MAG: hypothetical protein ACOCRO_04395 [Halanaerobiales bacterium]